MNADKVYQQVAEILRELRFAPTEEETADIETRAQAALQAIEQGEWDISRTTCYIPPSAPADLREMAAWVKTAQTTGERLRRHWRFVDKWNAWVDRQAATESQGE